MLNLKGRGINFQAFDKQRESPLGNKKKAIRLRFGFLVLTDNARKQQKSTAHCGPPHSRGMVSSGAFTCAGSITARGHL